MRLGDLDRLAKDIEMAVEDAPLHVQATVQQYIDCSPTIDPIRAVGGCYCRECKWYEANGICGWTSTASTKNLRDEGDFCSDGEPREARDDG